jgi:hypothetical protein
MKSADFSGVLQKIEELRAMMVFMHRTLPFLEDVFTFVKEIVPQLNLLKSSVESTSEKLPKASVQLNKVTTATELASTEILNIVEGISSRTDKIRAGLGGTVPREELNAELDSIQNDCTNIMIALQVQDITAQQIASVNELMQSVDEGLSRLLRNFEKSTKHDATQYRHQKLNIVFDTSAEYTGGAERQRIADALVQEAKSAPARPQKAKGRPAKK